MSDQPVSRAELEALARRVDELEVTFDAHRTVIIAALSRVEGKVDAVNGRLDETVVPALTEQGTLLRSIARHLGLE